MDSWKRILGIPEILSRIFSHLSTPDLQECQLVNKYWRMKLLDYRLDSFIHISGSTLREYESSNQTITQLFTDQYKNVYKVTINGWDHICGHIPNRFYDEIVDNPNHVKKLILRGRGVWESCRCPKNPSGSNGILVDHVPKNKMTNLEVLVVEESFTISSCTLLDIVARSPKLKMISFYGRTRKHEHVKSFNNSVIHSNLERIYWPFPTKKDAVALNFIVKRNNIRTIYSSMEVVCDLLSSDSLIGLKNLSLNLNEDWSTPNNDLKAAYNHAERPKILGLAKNLQSLVIRTYAVEADENATDDTERLLDRYFETYKLSFWEQIAKMSKLRYLCIYGAWDLEGICKAMSKHGLAIEYFHTNCLPLSVMDALDKEDTPVLQMTDAIRDLRNLTSLRSLSFHCADKMFDLDVETVKGYKDLIDKFWIVNIKVRWTPIVEDLLTSFMKRGAQSGKLYSIDVLIQPKDYELADVLMSLNLRVPSGSTVGNFVRSNAELAIKERYQNVGILGLYCWGVRLVDMPRDRSTFIATRTAWNTYKILFDPTTYGC